jgi:hypothetical protein
MTVFAYAMLAKDAELLLECFSRDSEWRSTNTVDKPWAITKLSYANLKAGLQPGGDYRGFLFGDDGDDSLRDRFVGASNAEWRAVDDSRFAPVDGSTEQPTFIRWEKRAARYVVSEIAFAAD